MTLFFLFPKILLISPEKVLFSGSAGVVGSVTGSGVEVGGKLLS